MAGGEPGGGELVVLHRLKVHHGPRVPRLPEKMCTISILFVKYQKTNFLKYTQGYQRSYITFLDVKNLEQRSYAIFLSIWTKDQILYF